MLTCVPPRCKQPQEPPRCKRSRISQSARHMHGLIHVVLKAFILERMGGQEVWDRILQELSVADDSAILDLETQYDDATTVAGVTAAAKVLGVEFDDALRAYGGYFVEYVNAGGHLRMLRSMGYKLLCGSACLTNTGICFGARRRRRHTSRSDSWV